METREWIEEQEIKTLAPYAAKSSETRGRTHNESKHPYRTDFQRDRDRIIHSTAFRRLLSKTQVYIENEGDYYRTRLTHSMETAQIARTISRALKLNEDLSETLALAHDLGHPPFGHAGEDALNECMKDYGGFEHNWQGIRIIEKLEKKYDEFDGLNLTWEVRESMRKHTIKPGIQIEKEYEPNLKPLLECQVVDIADYIAYNSHDIDDAIKANIITSGQIEKLWIWDNIKHAFNEQYFVRRSIRFLIDSMVSDLITNTTNNLRQSGINSVNDVRNSKTNMVSFSQKMSDQTRELYSFLMNNVYKHYKVVRMANKGKNYVKMLFDAFVVHPEQLPTEFRNRLKQEEKQRVICDYIAGMTDRYAQTEVKKLFYPFEHLL